VDIDILKVFFREKSRSLREKPSSQIFGEQYAFTVPWGDVQSMPDAELLESVAAVD
jgi:hypothetical protein